MANTLGTSFSLPQLEFLQLSPQESLAQAVELGFSHIRLGAYWSRIEGEPNRYDFSELQALLNQCQQARQSVVLTIGVKAPRWPEFYWPTFIAEKTTSSLTTQLRLWRFITQTVKALRSFDCITHWQVENEPLDPSGPENLAIAESFLAQEVGLVRSLDSRPIIVTLWGNALKQRRFFTTATQLADVVGIDLYYSQFAIELFGRSFYKGPSQSDSELQKVLDQSSKPVWIAELQAEPWEKNEHQFRAASPKSMSLDQLKKNLNHASQLPVAETLLWGFEYWLWRAKHGDSSYLDFIKAELAT